MAPATVFAWILLAGCGTGRGTRAQEAPPTTATVVVPSATPGPPPAASIAGYGATGLGKIAFDGGYYKALPDGEVKNLPFSSDPQWSPSGKWLLFEVVTGEQWVMRADECGNGPLGTVCPQARQLDEHGYAAWSPKGDQLAYVIGGYQTSALVAENADGSQRREWPLPIGEPRGVRWSPDGKWIAAAEVVKDGGRRSELWIIPSESSKGPVERPVPTLQPPPTSVPLEERTGRVTLQVSASVPTDSPIIGEMGAVGATVEVIGDGIDLRATTAERGSATFKDIPVSTDSKRPTIVNVIISAPGYAPFSFKWLALYDGSAPILSAGLSDEPQVDDLSRPVPPIRPVPTPLPLLTSPAPPPGGIELYGGAEDGIELEGWSGDSKYVLFRLDERDFQYLGGEPVSPLRAASIDGGLTKLSPALRDTDLWQATPQSSLILMTESTSRDMWTGQRIVLADAARGEVTYLTDEDTASQQPSWSPDGRQIAYVSQPDRDDATGETDEEFAQLVAGRHIWVMNNDGTGKRQLTDDPRYRDEQPLWSKDGSMILFTRVDTGGSVSLWLVAASGGEPQQVAAIDSSSEGGLWRYPGGAGWGSLFDWWRGP